MLLQLVFLVRVEHVHNLPVLEPQTGDVEMARPILLTSEYEVRVWRSDDIDHSLLAIGFGPKVVEGLVEGHVARDQ